MQHPAVAGIFTDALLIADDDGVLPQSLWERAGFSPLKKRRFVEDPVGVLLRQDIATGATMIFQTGVRDLYTRIPPQWVHDGWLAWMIVLHREKTGQLKPLELKLTRYRIHSSQQTGAIAARIGNRSEPLPVRLQKARDIGHAHHRQSAERLRLVLRYWLDRGGTQGSKTAARLNATIHLLESRAALPDNRLARLLAIVRLLPYYIRYGAGLVSAGRDLWI